MLSEVLVALLVFSVWKCEAQGTCIISGSAGTCLPIRDCLEALNNYKRHRIRPQFCQNTRNLVCCAPVEDDKQRPQSNRISAQKCQEYAKAVPLSGRDICPFTAVQLIIGGEKANEREFPHMALIGYSKSLDDFDFLCGGSLISEQFVLSAAHCTFTSALKQATHVKLGDVRRGQNNINTYSYEIGERLKHPDYKYSSIDNDIALFKLAVVVTLNAYVRPICLPHLDEITKSATATGWGQLGAFDHQSKVLLKVNLDIFNQSSCQKSYDKSGKTANGIDYVTKICAGSYEKMKDTCGGDSGGPLQIFNKDNLHCTYTQVGITSFGHLNCGSIGVPGVYTRVFPYLDWIEGIVWPKVADGWQWN